MLTSTTQKRLRELFHYDPKTGIFTNLTARNSTNPIGSIAGKPNCTGYCHIYFDGQEYAAHRLAWLYMTGEWPKKGVDHENGNPSNNSWNNLREANQSQNGSNAKKYSTNKSGHKGVFLKSPGRWGAKIYHQKKGINLGYYPSVEEAAEVVRQARIRIHGEFARFE